MTNKNVYFNPNPIKREIGDCVVRAICKALDKPWEEVYWDLCKLGLELSDMPNGGNTWKAYLEKHNFAYVPCKVQKGKKRPRVDNLKVPKGYPAIVRVSHHVVCLMDNKYYDIWESGDCSVYGYWISKEAIEEEN